MNLQKDRMNHHWTLFLDRDGVINQRIMEGYVTSEEQFVLIEGAARGIAGLTNYFGRVVVVTNQQGIAKGLMTEEDLDAIHRKMIADIQEAGGKIDAVLHCPDIAGKIPSCRKPEITMGLRAKKRFPEIHFKKSVMIGDTFTDMLFAHRLGMRKVLVLDSDHTLPMQKNTPKDLIVASLYDFYMYIVDNNGFMPIRKK